uniref:Fibrinogen C-terminal domain-containing protein n=1 Tax=Gadus morhua TaxID=8049 RepID=A0A8C5CNJ6_GADMO
MVVNLVGTPESLPVDCSDLYSNGFGNSGVYTIFPAGPTSPVQVFCEMGSMDAPDSNKWTVIQRRTDGTINFYRGWEQYKTGFGQASSEYWLGLENIHLLSGKKSYKLRVDMEDFDGAKVFAEYSSFNVAPEKDGYRLTFSGFKDGGAGDSMHVHNGQKFSTFDMDQDSFAQNCAKMFLGGWWYVDCHHANPNGEYLWGESHYGLGNENIYLLYFDFGVTHEYHQRGRQIDQVIPKFRGTSVMKRLMYTL